MRRDCAEWWSKRGCVGRNFLVAFQEQAAACQLDYSPPLLGLPPRQQGKRRGPPGHCLAEGLCCRVSAGAPATSVAPWEGAGRGLPARLQRWDASPWAPFWFPPADPSDTGPWKAAAVEGLARMSCPAASVTGTATAVCK